MFSKEYFQSLESSWDRLKTCEKPIFIYGMGDGAEKLLDEFDRLGIKCTGVFASDDFVRGQSFRGFKVQTFSQVQAQFGDITVVLGFGTSLPEIMAVSYTHLTPPTT